MLDIILYCAFAFLSILLTVVILVQEGRGGGLGDAFGGAGQQTFGVGARGITRFTAWIGVAFVALALAMTLKAKSDSGSVAGGPTVEPFVPAGVPQAPSTPGGG